MQTTMDKEATEALYALNRARGRIMDGEVIEDGEAKLAKLTEARDIVADLLGIAD